MLIHNITKMYLFVSCQFIHFQSTLRFSKSADYFQNQLIGGGPKFPNLYHFPSHLQMPFAAKSFYRTTITKSRIQNQLEKQTIVLPNPESSEDESGGSDDEEVGFERVASNMKESNVDDESDFGQRDDVSASDYSVDEDQNDVLGETSSSDEQAGPSKQPVSSKPGKASYRWRRREPMQQAATFTGENFQDPPGIIPSPLECFNSFFDKDLMARIVEQTNLYSVQQTGKSVKTDANEMEKFLGILVMMGIFHYPQYRMYWTPETRIVAIADSMSVNRFENPKRFFHVNDNSKIPKRGDPNYDPLYKVRPMVNSILEKCHKIPNEENNSIDEQIIPTKARSSIKQYLPKKPNKWGFKVWARAGISGIIYDFEIYTGKENDKKTGDFGATGNLVLRLCKGIPHNQGYKVFFDNLFTSIELIKELKSRGIWSAGTIRANRLKGAQRNLKSYKDLKKEGRGAVDYQVDANSNVVIVRWYDNGVVQLASTFLGIDMGLQVRRWSAAAKEHVEIQCPNIVRVYNANMGCVDLCDMLLALYRITLGTKKWYMHIVYHCIGLSIVNSWLCYRRHCE